MLMMIVMVTTITELHDNNSNIVSNAYDDSDGDNNNRIA